MSCRKGYLNGRHHVPIIGRSVKLRAPTRELVRGLAGSSLISIRYVAVGLHAVRAVRLVRGLLPLRGAVDLCACLLLALVGRLDAIVLTGLRGLRVRVRGRGRNDGGRSRIRDRRRVTVRWVRWVDCRVQREVGLRHWVPVSIRGTLSVGLAVMRRGSIGWMGIVIRIVGFGRRRRCCIWRGSRARFSFAGGASTGRHACRNVSIRDVSMCSVHTTRNCTFAIGRLGLPLIRPSLDALLPFLPLPVYAAVCEAVLLAALTRPAVITAFARGGAVRALWLLWVHCRQDGRADRLTAIFTCLRLGRGATVGACGGAE